ETFQPGGRVYVFLGCEALDDSRARGRPSEDLSAKLPAQVRDQVLWSRKDLGRSPEQSRHRGATGLPFEGLHDKGSSGEGIEIRGYVVGAAEEGLDLGHVHHPDVMGEAGDDGSRWLSRGLG